MDKNKKPYFVGVCGGSASGKTFLLKQLLEHYGEDQLTLISMDHYYKPFDSLPKDPAGKVNYDHPSTLELDRFAADLKRLINGETVEIQEYTFNNSDKIPETIIYKPAPIIIVEGLFVFYHPKVSELLDLRIFVDADEHIKMTRRIKRDFEERGYDLDDVLYRYEAHVYPMYKKYIEPYKWDADIIIHNNSTLEKAVEVIMDHLQKQLD